MATAPTVSPSTYTPTSRDWRGQLGARLVEPDEAVGHIKSGDRIVVSIAQATPLTVCTALSGRLMELENVVVNHGAAAFNWDLPGLGERYRLESMYCSPYDRSVYAAGRAEFVPVSYYREGSLPPGLENFNVCLIKVTPPDENGFVNFGDIQIMQKMLARAADLVIAEIDPKLIRVGGDNQMHLSEIDYFVEGVMPFPEAILPPPNEEEQRAIATVCATVAKEFVHDRDTIQIGVGSMSGMLMYHLGNHHDLGMQTEIIPWGTTPLVRDGVLTGKYKKIFPELVVGAAFAVLTPQAELELANGNPRYQLYDFNFTDDIRLIAKEEGLISINNALNVDLTGQANAESHGPMMYTGTGGQTAFVIGASMGGGETIIVTPSISMVKGQRFSRIMPGLPPGSVITSPRTFVHNVVTEYGVARLKGKSIRDRANQLIAVAHPDFRNELRAEAKRMYGV
jgi:4-hydroxybutyrate CoA-transferase